MLRAAANQGGPIPPQLLGRPDLLPGLELYLIAYLDLRSCAPDGGATPWTAVRAWADEMRLAGDQRLALFHHCKALDAALLKWRRDKEDASRERSRPLRNRDVRPR